jgi:cell wall-associated NlpC family hydrolase
VSRRHLWIAAAGALLLTGCGSEGPATPAAGVRAAKPKSAPARAFLDTEASQSYATPAGVRLTKKPPTPGAAAADARAEQRRATDASDGISPGAPSDAEIARELKQMDAVLRKQKKAGGTGHGITLEADGTATVAPNVPTAVAQVVAGANAIAKFPYVYGGGHRSFVDTAYDCSGSLSYALAAAGLLTSPKTSGELASAGARGPGRWITIYANAGHTFMVVDGLRYDTSGRGGPLGTRWNRAPRSVAGFTVRHPPGL